ncbi:MAG: alpha/beta fold hydrolase [Betaproteobacteria bacterium]|nr:alpha/beta fold hydrolase [Betaproteobacteria bacterium]
MTRKKKTSLFFLHGWAMTPAVWQPLIAAIGAFETHTPALPGHDGNIPFAAPALAAWADALAPALPLKATVIGWSLGALLALELARIHPDRVERLILLGATPRFVSTPDWPHGLDAATVSSFTDGYIGQPTQTLRRFLTLQTLGETSRRQLLPQLEAVAVPHTGVPLPALVDGLKILTGSDLRPQLAEIRQPVRLIHGSNDALMPLEAARRLTAALPCARLSVLEHCGHALPLSRPNECAEIIRASLDERDEP